MAIAIAVVALVSFLVWAIIFTLDDADRITTRDVGFTVNDEFSTEVIFEVSRNPGQIVICDVQVLSQSFAVVGLKTLTVEPSERRSVVISTTVVTTEIGTTGLVASCR
jgi:DNA integrity scanning protein DisA with diadenylate cyclase activity